MSVIKVAIADDHKIVLEGLQFILSDVEEVKVVFTAQSAEQFQQLLRQHEVDVAILDINLPDMNGIDLAKLLKTQYPKLPIIFLTMHKRGGYVREAIDIGAWGYILKDSPKEELITSITSAHQGKTHFGAEIMDLAISKKAGSYEFTELTKREIEVLGMIVSGMSSREIADKLCVSINTVKTHRTNIFSKLPVNNVVELTSYAMENSLIPRSS